MKRIRRTANPFASRPAPSQGRALWPRADSRLPGASRSARRPAAQVARLRADRFPGALCLSNGTAIEAYLKKAIKVRWKPQPVRFDVPSDLFSSFQMDRDTLRPLREIEESRQALVDHPDTAVLLGGSSSSIARLHQALKMHSSRNVAPLKNTGSGALFYE